MFLDSSSFYNVTPLDSLLHEVLKMAELVWSGMHRVQQLEMLMTGEIHKTLRRVSYLASDAPQLQELSLFFAGN